MPFTCENYGNDPWTVIISDVDSFDTTITVNDTIPNYFNFPATPFRIRMNDELMLVTSTIGPTWTVTRGEEGTTPQFHVAGSRLDNVITIEGLFNRLRCYSEFGAYSTLPALEKLGRLFFTDTPGWYLLKDDETSWKSWGGIYKLTEPDNTGFSWVNQGSATLSTTNGAFELVTPAPGGAGEDVKIRVESAPATPYTVTGCFFPGLSPENQTSCGLVFRRSTGIDAGKFIFFRFMFDTTSVIAKHDTIFSLDKYTNPTTFSANYKTVSGSIWKSPVIWMQMEDDGTDLTWRLSNDGLNFDTIDTRTRTDFMTGGPEQIGLAVNSNTTAGGSYMTLLSWKKV